MIERAFSLIELLVVIVIVAVLAALLLPSISLVRASAQAVTCGSYLRMIGMAQVAYASDNDGMLVPVSPPDGINWEIRLAECMDDDQVITASDRTEEAGRRLRQCKAAPGRVKDTGKTKSGYGMNYKPLLDGPVAQNPRSSNASTKSTTTWTNVAVARIPRPATKILAGDSSDWALMVFKSAPSNAVDASFAGTAFWGHALPGWPDACSLVSTTEHELYYYGDPIRHRGTANYLHADGHVERLAPEIAGPRMWWPSRTP